MSAIRTAQLDGKDQIALIERPNKILILDAYDQMRRLTRRFADTLNIGIVLATTAAELEEALNTNPDLQFFILDSEVPEDSKDNTRGKPQLPRFFHTVKEEFPDAEVWSTAFRVSPQEATKLMQAGVTFIEKTRIFELMEELREKIVQAQTQN